jgi:hypothetical protein
MAYIRARGIDTRFEWRFLRPLQQRARSVVVTVVDERIAQIGALAAVVIGHQGVFRADAVLGRDLRAGHVVAVVLFELAHHTCVARRSVYRSVNARYTYLAAPPCLACH